MTKLVKSLLLLACVGQMNGMELQKTNLCYYAHYHDSMPPKPYGSKIILMQGNIADALVETKVMNMHDAYVCLPNNEGAEYKTKMEKLFDESQFNDLQAMLLYRMHDNKGGRILIGGEILEEMEHNTQKRRPSISGMLYEDIYLASLKHTKKSVAFSPFGVDCGYPAGKASLPAVQAIRDYVRGIGNANKFEKIYLVVPSAAIFETYKKTLDELLGNSYEETAEEAK